MNKDINILIVEDEVFAMKYLHKILNSLGYVNIYEASNANDALKLTYDNTIDLIFMDINIEGAIDGLQCAKLINEKNLIPIIFTTAYGDSGTIKEANETNTFGYIVKPFEQHDVEAVLSIALKMVNRNNQPKNNPIPEYIERINLENNYIFNFSTKTLFINNKPIDLSKKELDLLFFLCSNINNNISYEILKEKVWLDNTISNSTIRDTISRLKKKTPLLKLLNIQGFGYILQISN